MTECYIEVLSRRYSKVESRGRSDDAELCICAEEQVIRTSLGETPCDWALEMLVDSKLVAEEVVVVLVDWMMLNA